MHIHLHRYKNMYIYMYLYVYIYVYIYIYRHMCMCICICICIYVYVYVCLHLYTSAIIRQGTHMPVIHATSAAPREAPVFGGQACGQCLLRFWGLWRVGELRLRGPEMLEKGQLSGLLYRLL